MGIFRKFLTDDVIAKYESRTSPGSLYWLEERLVEGMIRGTHDSAGRNIHEGLTLNDMSKKVNEIFIELTKEWELEFRSDDAAQLAVEFGELARGRDAYGRVLAGLVFYDACQRDSGVAAATAPLGPRALDSLVSNPPDLRAGNAAAAVPIQGRGDHPIVLQRELIYDDREGLNSNRSLMMAFNQVLGKYLTRFYDGPSAKIYHNLINSIANKTLSSSVNIPGYSHPDLFGPRVETFRCRADPTEKSILLTSLAIILRRLTKDVNIQGTGIHTVATLSDIPLYMREKYKALLPIFIKQFKTLEGYGEFLKRVVQRTQINLGRPIISTIINVPNNAVFGTYARGNNRDRHTILQTGESEHMAGQILPIEYFARNITFAAPLGNTDNVTHGVF